MSGDSEKCAKWSSLRVLVEVLLILVFNSFLSIYKYLKRESLSRLGPETKNSFFLFPALSS